jgi:hypothetical protein
VSAAVVFSPTQHSENDTIRRISARLTSTPNRAMKSMLALTSRWRLQVSHLFDVKKKILQAELINSADIDYN